MTAGERIRVVVVDDHAMVRRGVRQILDAAGDIETVGEAANGAEAVEACGRLRPDVVLMDLVMPVMDGAAATAEITRACPDCRVVVLTSYVEKDLVRRAMDGGAISYVVKDAPPESLVQVVRDAAAGRGIVDASAARLLRQEEDPVGRDLTDRERQVLQLVVQGLGNAEIGERLGLSAATARMYVSRILQKLDAPNRTRAVVIAIGHGLVDVND